MIQAQLKLKLNSKQEAVLKDWLWMLTGVWNWAIKKIELDAQGGIYYSEKEFQNLLAEHGKKIGIPSHTMQGVLLQAHTAWKRCFKKIGGKPKLKGARNKLNSIPFPDPIKSVSDGYAKLPGIGLLRYHKQDIPAGKIKCGRIVKRASGWYLCVFIDADRKPIQGISNGEIGIDPGFKSLIATSDGEKIRHPQELQKSLKRLGQAQRGINRKLVARIHERIANQRKDRNHKLSLRLVKENSLIAFSKDNTKGMARTYGKSVASSGHSQLKQMLSYKCRAGGSKYVEVDSKNSTRTCSACGALTGPRGRAGLKVRHWVCACGAQHDRDINAARNTLFAALGMSVELCRQAA
jgi:putative transposase